MPTLAYSFTTCGGEDHYTYANVLQGATLRVAFEPVDTPWMRAAVASDGTLANGRVGARVGFVADVFYRLQAEAGFNVMEVTATSSDYWWDSCINDTIFGNRVDLCVGNIWVTNDRTLRGALFTHDIAPRASLHIISAAVQMTVYDQLTLVFEPFTISVWIVLMLCVFGFTIATFMANDDLTAREEAWHELIAQERSDEDRAKAEREAEAEAEAEWRRSLSGVSGGWRPGQPLTPPGRAGGVGASVSVKMAGGGGGGGGGAPGFPATNAAAAADGDGDGASSTRSWLRLRKSMLPAEDPCPETRLGSSSACTVKVP